MSSHPSTLLALLFLAVPTLPAQVKQADRITVQPELTTSVRLAGHLPRWANPATDAGAVASETRLHLTFVLARAPEQEAAFTQLLADQQDPTSPRYYQWLTPQQAGDLYGPTQHDIDAFTAWLASSGFGAADVAPSRMFVNVSASASTVAAALSTSFHYFTLNGEPRISTTQEPAFPAAIASIVRSVDGLSDTPILPMGHGEGMPAASVAQPRYTNSSAHYIAPNDFATIFNFVAPYGFYLSGIGQKVAVIGRSRIVTTDITEFEANTGISQNIPNTIVPGAGPDPGVTGTGDQSEATLDIERVIATAPSAQVDLVVLPSSGGGILSAAQYEVNTLNDPVMNISFGSCELGAGAAGVKTWDTLFSQAASQGISVFISAMDSGAAGCDNQFNIPPATQFASISYICASSYATCVGGTEFADTANPSLYWSSNNNASLGSVLGYIPEGAWNEPTSGSTYVVASGGGGASLYITKPTWQTGAGVPADGARDVPDVSYPSSGHDGYYGCYAAGNGDCAINRFEYFYGTSAAAPAMAGLTAILNQRNGTRQGNLNPILYQLAANPANAVFHDVTVASSGVTNCSASVPSMCNNSTPSPTALTGGLAGYVVGAGYDLVTGWGSIDANRFLATLGTPQVQSFTTLSASSLAIYTGNTVTFTATVTSPSPGKPTGFVQLYQNRVALGSAIALSPSGIAVSPAIPYNAAGNFSITAIYSGDGGFAVSQPGTLSLTVNNPGFSITAAPTSLSFTAGAVTGNTATLTYTSLGGFSGTINQACLVAYNGGTAIDTPTCTYTAPSVTLPAGGTVTGTITIISIAPSGAGGSAALRIGGSGGPARPDPASLAGVAFGTLLLAFFTGRRRLRPNLWRSLSLAIVIAAALASTSGCGGGGSSAPPPSGSSPGPYTITLTSASGATSATPAATIPLTIR
jgi:pseudomonalisin